MSNDTKKVIADEMKSIRDEMLEIMKKALDNINTSLPNLDKGANFHTRYYSMTKMLYELHMAYKGLCSKYDLYGSYGRLLFAVCDTREEARDLITEINKIEKENRK